MVTGHDDIKQIPCYFLMGSNSENRDNNERFLGSQCKTSFFTSKEQFKKLVVIVFLRIFESYACTQTEVYMYPLHS